MTVPTTAPEHYRAERTATSELYRSLSDEQLATTVPGSPKWTVRDVLAHLVGFPVDLANGVMDNAGSPEWTQKQVDDRAPRSVPELLEEWDEAASKLEASMDDIGQLAWIFVMDTCLHLDDAREALGVPLCSGPTHELVIGRMVKQAEGRAGGLGTLTLRGGSKEWTVGSGSPTTSVSVESSQELSRVLAARRSDDQVRALDWEGDPEPWLPVLPLFREGR